MEIRKNYFDFYTPEEWKEIIADQKESGLSMHAYCKMKKIPCTSFYGWRGRLYPTSCTNLKGIEDKWKKVIEDWEKSGLSLREFCREKELSTGVVSQWKKRLNPTISKKTALEKWKGIIEDWRMSGLKKADYCRKKKLVPSSFYFWEKKLNFSEPSRQFSEVKKEPESNSAPLQDLFISLASNSTVVKGSSTTPRIELMLSQGHCLCLEGSFDREALNLWLTPFLKTEN